MKQKTAHPRILSAVVAAVVCAASFRGVAESSAAPIGEVYLIAQAPSDAPPQGATGEKKATKTISVRHEGVMDAAGNIVDTTTIVKTAPPEPRQETVRTEVRPAEDAIWLPGYWQWDAGIGDYVWINGLWRRAIPGATWHPGQWVKAPDGYQWAPGFWARESGAPAATSTSTTTTTPARIVVPKAPPIAKEEVRPTPPSADMTWVNGTWVYENNEYVWKSGHWELPPAQKMIWTPDRWFNTAEGYTLVPGHWDYPVESRVYVVTPK